MSYYHPAVQMLMMSINNIELENERIRSDYMELDSCIAMLRKRINTMEQQNLYNYVEIIGVPVSMDGDYVKVVEEIGAALEIELTVVKAKRLSYELTNTNIIVAELLTYEQKFNLIRKSKQDELAILYALENDRSTRIHIRDHLTEYNRTLYFHTKMFAREKGFKYVWYADCQIFLKKSDRSRIFLIEKETDLCNIVCNTNL